MPQKSKGLLLALVTVSIWAGWMIVTRYGVSSHSSHLHPLDIAMLRFATAGIIFFPITFKNRKLIFQTPLLYLFIMVLGAGAPYVYVSAIAFQKAPASHGILIPGTMPLWVALFSWLFLKEKFSKLRLAGYLFIFIGMLLKLKQSMQDDASLFSIDFYFLIASLLWSLYTLGNRKSNLDALTATAWVTTGSLVGLIPFYIYHQMQDPHSVQIRGALLQIFYQGIITSIISLITYNKAMQILGAAKASAFTALVPVLVTLMAIPILDEYPQTSDLIFVFIMSMGVLFTSGVFGKVKVV